MGRVTKKELYALIQQLPEEELPSVKLFVQFLMTRDPVLLAFASAPWDDEPVTPEEDEGAAEAWQEYRRGDVISSEEAKRRLLS